MKHKRDYPVRESRRSMKGQGRESLARKRDAYDRETKRDTNGLTKWTENETNGWRD